MAAAANQNFNQTSKYDHFSRMCKLTFNSPTDSHYFRQQNQTTFIKYVNKAMAAASNENFNQTSKYDHFSHMCNLTDSCWH